MDCISSTEDGGTEEQSVATEDGNKCCLTDDVILRLARIGVKVIQTLLINFKFHKIINYWPECKEEEMFLMKML